MKTAEVENKKKSMGRKRLMVAGAVGLPFLLFALFTDHGLIKRLSLESQHTELLQELEVERQRTDSLQRKIEALTTDTVLIEKIARERYGMLKPGEEAYIIEQTDE